MMPGTLFPRQVKKEGLFHHGLGVNKNAIMADYKTANSKQIQAAYEYEQTILNAYREVANTKSVN